MPTRKPSAKPSAKLSPQSERTALGKRLVASARQAAAHLRGEIVLNEYSITVPETIDVAAVRERFGLSQAKFAASFGLDLDALQAWEQRRRRPDRTARILLTVIAREPEAVRRALG